MERPVYQRRATDQYLNAILDAAQEVAIIATDAEGRITVFNRGAERMLGYASADMLGKSPLTLHRASELERRAAELTRRLGRPVQEFDILAALVRDGEAETRSWTYVCRDGACLRVSLTMSAVRNADQQTIGYLGVARDISAQLRAEAQLVKMNLELEQLVDERTLALQASTDELQAALRDLQSTQGQLVQSAKMASLGELVAGIAHEINTPVGIAVTSASVLQRATVELNNAMEAGTLRKSEILAYMTMTRNSTDLILKNTERAAGLIQSFKQVAVDQTSEQRRKYGLRTYLEEVMHTLMPALRKAKLQVAIQCADEVAVDGYPGAMAQVFTNLAMNAITHAYPHGGPGKLTITAESDGEQVRVRFQDDGCGIDPANIGKIFDPFFTTRRGEGGTGLGLNIVYNIVHSQFGGSISVSSERGTGTAFFLQFPLVLEKSEAP